MKILGITGKIKSGKSTIAEIIQMNYSRTVVINFADALKDEVAVACGVTRTTIDTSKDIFRPILQWWGTDFRRNLYGDDYWIKRWLHKVSKLPPDVRLVVAADVRFENEAKCVKELGGELWRVFRSTDGQCSTHASETDMNRFNCDLTMENEKMIKDLIEIVKQQIEKRIK